MGDISIFFFKKIVGVANMRYFNAQHVALDHRVEEREINHALHDDDVVQMEGDANDLALRDVQCKWMEEDSQAGWHMMIRSAWPCGLWNSLLVVATFV